MINDPLSFLPPTLTLTQPTFFTQTLRSLPEMRFLLSLPVIAVSFFVANVAANLHGSPHARRHDAIARRAPGDVSTDLQKRFDSARWTFYDVGL